ncbi:putative tyrosyl-DNA phosphodiesterase [Talaromyces proteolyticus]|uniref:Tyrosyl-DNA phosphodiesterase n=1 Tax=Talaromyces proteolyticus TaxID=1131652 RepID=A0AAD4KG56_9EURO|nr:putative tyrosyl-DNA phosphodiesterase [Talaromyces proteolyticus]KAH8691319.1 putative tyrosyl-DNA phosphodiesterase [Talaromyces proteolyticus]
MDRPVKRQRVSEHKQEDTIVDPATVNTESLASLSRSITPPLRLRAGSQQQPSRDVPSILGAEHFETQSVSKIYDNEESDSYERQPRVLRSPVQLSHIRDLPHSSGNNVDTIQLRDILGDPLIRECWQFNYCFDVDFIMRQFDEDVRNIVKVKIVHGSWKKDSPNRIGIDEACTRYPNTEAITAYMPEPFGTHHSKMMVLLRHDDLAQVIIHTANMIPGDWENMTQAIWRSPLLPLASPATTLKTKVSPTFGSGERFKRDLIAYLNCYGSRKTGSLVSQLKKCDFTSVRAALIASVPSKEKLCNIDSTKSTIWGWPALKDTIRQVPLKSTEGNSNPHIVIQVSSIATLGQTDKWLKEALFSSLSPVSASSSPGISDKTKYSIIFPTPDEIRRSLHGYASGGSIHMKLQSAAQKRQLQYLRPFFCHWAGDQDNPTNVRNATLPKREAGRRRAAPHIKTYIRFSDQTTMDRIDWAMVTSANLSTQAWGSTVNANGEVRVCSWEIGVILWPGLIADNPKNTARNNHAEMIPCFKKDTPIWSSSIDSDVPLVGFRMPYDLPLTPYNAHDVPWCATTSHLEPDWLGQTWTV